MLPMVLLFQTGNNKTMDKLTKCYPREYPYKADYVFVYDPNAKALLFISLLLLKYRFRYPAEKDLKRHIKSCHDPERAIICDKCGKPMSSQWILRKHHELMHSDVPRPVPVPMQCQICGSWLRHASGLKVHIRRVHEEAGVENRCHICNKTSTTARALKRHIYHNHECKRKFKCSMCEKAFKRPQDLREHTSTHTGEVLYNCPHCTMTFFCKANMHKHRRRKHPVEWERDRKKPRLPNIMQQAVDTT